MLMLSHSPVASPGLTRDVQLASYAIEWLGGKFDGCATDASFLWLLTIHADVRNIVRLANTKKLPIDMDAGMHPWTSYKHMPWGVYSFKQNREKTHQKQKAQHHGFKRTLSVTVCVPRAYFDETRKQ